MRTRATRAQVPEQVRSPLANVVFCSHSRAKSTPHNQLRKKKLSGVEGWYTHINGPKWSGDAAATSYINLRRMGSPVTDLADTSKSAQKIPAVTT